MKDETAHSTASFIQKTVMNNKPYIEWFGGEPLMNSRAISLICRDLENSGISFFSKITTNGSLWTDKIILEARDKWNLRSVQITLDGINEEHQRIKGLPQGSFRRAIRSIHKLADINIRVRIRINHYEGQEHLHFIHWLAKEFSGKPDISAYVTPGYRAGKEYSETLMKEVLNLNLYLKDAGLIYRSGKFLPRRIHTGCFACNPHNYTIAPDGKIFDCTHAMSDTQCIGDVWAGTQSPEKRDFLRKKFSEKCKNCTLLPVCMGGCRAAEIKMASMTHCPPFKKIVSELMQFEENSGLKSAVQYN